MKKIFYISGSRADYGPARQLLLKLHNHTSFDLNILVCGMHLDPIHGETYKEIEKDGLNIIEEKVKGLDGDNLSSMAGSVGLYLYEFSKIISKYNPDIILVLGDRGEQLSGAMAGAFQNIPVVHLCGGTLSGSIDDSIRHAITKFSHYHLTPFKDSRDRIIQMGENPKFVKVVGMPGGNINCDVKYSKKEILKKYKMFDYSSYFLVIQHSVTHSRVNTKQQIIATLEALKDVKKHVLLANPNDDAGGRIILENMIDYARKYSHMHILKPVSSREVFASIMAHSEILIGNSSSGIIEAMSVKTPTVNIGDRQKGREYLTFSINVDYNKIEILKAVNKILFDNKFKEQYNNFVKDNMIVDGEDLMINELKSIDLNVSKNPKDFYNY